MRHFVIVAVMFLAGAAHARQADTEEAKKLNAEAREKIARFKKEFKAAGKKQMTASTAIMRLGEMQHALILTELKRHLVGPSTVIVGATANEVRKYKGDKSAAMALLAAASKNRESSNKVLCLRAIGDIGYRPIAKSVASQMRTKDTAVVREVISVLGRLKSKLGVSSLMSAGKEFEKATEKERKDLLPNVFESLGMITGQKFTNMEEWAAWWRKNKTTFKEVK